MSSIAVHHRPSVLARAAVRVRALGLGGGGRDRRDRRGRAPRRRRQLPPAPARYEATDHLVSGLVPLALLGLAAWAYPRVRPGARATLAILLGVFALVTSVEAVYYAREQGASGDDYTGFLAIPAGLALLAIGIGTLWRSRRLDSHPRRYARRTLIALRRHPGVPVRRLPRRLLVHRDARRAVHPRARRPRPDGPARELHDERRPDPEGPLHPVQQRRRRDRLAGLQRRARPRADARPPRLRRPALRPARRGPQRGRPERLGLVRREGHARRDRASSSARPTSTTGASAASASPSPASRSCRPPRTTDELRAVVSEGAGAARTRSGATCPAPAAGSIRCRSR